MCYIFIILVWVVSLSICYSLGSWNGLFFGFFLNSLIALAFWSSITDREFKDYNHLESDYRSYKRNPKRPW